MSKKVSILIVEDDPLIAEDISGHLQALNFSVAGIFHTAETALGGIERHRPDAVLLDIHLGDGPDGISVAHEINNRWDIPFVFLTSYADRRTIEEVKKTIPAGYLVKPFNENDLLASLEIAVFNHMQRRTAAPARTLDDINHMVPTPLTEREFEIVQLLSQGKTNKEISEQLYLSVNTIKTHLLHIFEKLDVKNRTELLFRLSHLSS